MEDPHLTETEKSKTSEAKCEKYAHCFFRCSRNRAPGIRSSWTDCQSAILLVDFKLLRENLLRKRPEICRFGDWFLHHDKSPAHTALASLDWTVVPNQPYSPDLVPCDFFLFPTMKRILKGKRISTVEEVKTASKGHKTS